MPTDNENLARLIKKTLEKDVSPDVIERLVQFMPSLNEVKTKTIKPVEFGKLYLELKLKNGKEIKMTMHNCNSTTLFVVKNNVIIENWAHIDDIEVIKIINRLTESFVKKE